MVFRYCFGMTMSVSTLMIFKGAATPSSVVNLSIDRTSRLGLAFRRWFIANGAGIKGQIRLFSLRLDRLHVVVGQPKMMADFVNQDVADEMAQRLVMFGPVIQDRATVEPDHIGQPGNVVIAAKRQAYALEQAEQVEFAFRVHLVEHLVARKIVDTGDYHLARN